jgi:AmmeMemoRadiSam system protein A
METNPHPYVTLAIQSVRHYLEHGVPLPCPKNLTEDFQDPKSVFVTIKNGPNLRGCIGDLTPFHDTLAKEIIHNATSAASRDPRFPPVSLEELPNLKFSVDVLTPLEKVEDISQLDCRQFGLAVKSEEKLGVLLPDLEGVDTVQDQLRICLKKGRIDKDEPFDMYRFEVVRYH